VHSLYFAYGSNLASERMRERVPAARVRGAARLAGFRLVTDKPGRDGTAKANLVSDAAAHVWGVLWELAARDLAALDRAEGGYERIGVVVATPRGPLHAQTYLSHLRGSDRALARGYKTLLLAGAREHALPGAWRRFLASLPER